MSHNSSEDLRSTAELLINQTRTMPSRGAGHPSGFDICMYIFSWIFSAKSKLMLVLLYFPARTHSINLITEEFLGGYMQDGRMSVIRRFFCLFVTFDLFFVSLLWLICIMVSRDKTSFFPFNMRNFCPSIDNFHNFNLYRILDKWR